MTLESEIPSPENKAFLLRNMSEIAEIISEVTESRQIMRSQLINERSLFLRCSHGGLENSVKMQKIPI